MDLDKANVVIEMINTSKQNIRKPVEDLSRLGKSSRHKIEEAQMKKHIQTRNTGYTVAPNMSGGALDKASDRYYACAKGRA